MKKLSLTLALLALVTSCGKETTNHNEARFIDSSIVGGTQVDPATTDTSFIVSLGGECAGTIIGSKWILTAAHCESVFNLPITAGNTDVRSNNRIRLKMKDYYIHPNHESFDWGDRYDFALIELKEEIDFPKTHLSLLDISNPEFETAGGLAEGKMVTVYGWGATRENGHGTSLLREVTVPLVSRERGNAPTSYDGKIDSSMILAGHDEGGKDACQGDSGGPLVMKENNKTLLVGVVSWGEGCAQARYYGVYSNIAVASSWITKTINEKARPR
jgi:trypsin